jgi:hypothetical protein
MTTMKSRSTSVARLAALIGLWIAAAIACAQALPSWIDGTAKQAIVTFVTGVTTQGAPTFVAPEHRVAVFDNDGTLWAEQPLYFQLMFMLDQVKAAAPKHPDWKDDPVYKALVWAEPFTRLRVAKLFNLRTDPYERADVTSNTYYDFLLHNMYFLYAAQAAARKFAETFKEFPPAQKPGSFTIDDALKKMTEATSGAS